MWVTARTNMNGNPRETCFKNYERKRDAEVAPDLEPFGEEPNGPSNRRRPYILSNNATGAPAHEADAPGRIRKHWLWAFDPRPVHTHAQRARNPRRKLGKLEIRL
jgi:hypothetical protein